MRSACDKTPQASSALLRCMGCHALTGTTRSGAATPGQAHRVAVMHQMVKGVVCGARMYKGKLHIKTTCMTCMHPPATHWSDACSSFAIFGNRIRACECNISGRASSKDRNTVHDCTYQIWLTPWTCYYHGALSTHQQCQPKQHWSALLVCPEMTQKWSPHTVASPSPAHHQCAKYQCAGD